MKLRWAMGAVAVFLLLLAIGGYAFFQLVILPPPEQAVAVTSGEPAPSDTSAQAAPQDQASPPPATAKAATPTDPSLLAPQSMDATSPALVAPSADPGGSILTQDPVTGTFNQLDQTQQPAADPNALPPLTDATAPDTALQGGDPNAVDATQDNPIDLFGNGGDSTSPATANDLPPLQPLQPAPNSDSPLLPPGTIDGQPVTQQPPSTANPPQQDGTDGPINLF